MTEKNINRGFISKFRSLKDNSCDYTKLNLKDDFVQNFLRIFSEICNNNDELDHKSHIAYLNILVYLSKDLLMTFEHNDYFIISIYSIIKYSLWHNSRYVRIAGLRCLRYYMLNYRHVELLLRMRIDYIIMRSLDISYEDAMNNQYRGNDDAERIYIMRLIYRLSLIAPKLFPSTLINTLVGLCLIDVDKNVGILDLAIRPALMIMCNLVNINPAVTTHCRILDALQVAIFNADGKTWKLNLRIIEAVLLTQLKLAVHSQWRDTLPIGYFNKTLTPFSILSKVQPQTKVENSYQMNFTDEQCDFENTSISVLCTILQSWSGLLYLSSSNNKPILSITGILAVGCSEIRDRILDLLFQIFNIYRPPTDCCDFSSCMRSFVDQRSAKNNPNWALDDEFLVAQCLNCLTYISPSRINVLDNYEAVLLGVFVHNNLFEALANAVADEKESTSARAGILLANISYKVSILFPSDHPLSRRSDTANLLNNPKSNRALLWIEQVHKELEHYQYEITPFLTYIIQQHPNNSVSEDFLFSKRYLQPSNIDEILDSSCMMSSSILPKKSVSLSKTPTTNRLSALLDQVMKYCHMFEPASTDNTIPYYDQWNWDLLLVFARSLVDSKSQVSFDKDLLNRVLKILLKFFTPSSNGANDYSSGKQISQSFATLPLTWKHSSKAAFVVTDIISFMVEYYKSSEPQDDLNFFLFTIRSLLFGCLKSFLSDDKFTEITQHYDNPVIFTDAIFTEYDLTYKCSSYLILALGRLSASDLGEACLEESGIVEIFKTLLDCSPSDVYTKLILGSLDYARPSLGRSLLSIASSSTILTTRRYSVKFLRVLLRTKVPFFANWAINLLLKLIHDSDAGVKSSAFDILQEACEDEAVINNLSIDSMAILQLGYPGFMLFSRLLSLPFHFEKLVNRNSINLILDIWHEKSYDVEYCKRLDEQLMQHFTTYDIPVSNSDDPDEGRISNRVRFKAKELILPCHPFASLSAHKDGLDWLLSRGFLEDGVDVLSKEHKNIVYYQNFAQPGDNVSSCDCKELQLRANMLAVCHIATSAWGLEYAINMDVPILISDITKFHPSLNVRGTGLLCLGLIGSTPRGANILMSLDWMALRSDRFDKWPLLLDVYHHLYQTREEVKRQLYASTQKYSYNRSNSLFSESTDGGSEQTDIGVTVGYSVFAIPVYAEDFKQRDRKVTYDLIDNGIDGPTKCYAKSFDDCGIRSKAATINSSSSMNLYSEDERLSKFNKLINHRRDHSAGASSMFNVQIEEPDSLISPHDVLGIATMRRIQKKSRTGILDVASPFKSFSSDRDQSDSLDQSVRSANTDLFSNIRRMSVSDRLVTKRRKKFSSLITPRSNLNKYRGLIVPMNFTDLTINVLPLPNYLSSKVPGSDYQNNIRYSMLSYSDSESQNIPVKAAVPCNQSSKPYLNDKSFQNSCDRIIEKEDNGVSYPTYGTSGYISLEDSSCVLDLALIAAGVRNDEENDLSKTQRSSSDQRPNSFNHPISLRPRATTTSNCLDRSKSDIYGLHKPNSGYSISVPNIVINIRNNEMFVEGHMPTIHETRDGLTYHHSDYCLHIGCSGNREEPVSESVIEFRKEILYAVSGLIVLGPKTKKLEIGLAKLKSGQSQQMWSDLCLYSEICILLSLYNYSRQSRLYLQDLFISVPMDKLVDDMKNCFLEFSRQSESRCLRSTTL